MQNSRNLALWHYWVAFGTFLPAVLLGGIGAIVVTGLWAWMFPELRKAEDVGDLRS